MILGRLIKLHRANLLCFFAVNVICFLYSCAGTIIGNGLKPNDDEDDPKNGGTEQQDAPNNSNFQNGVYSHSDVIDIMFQECANPVAQQLASFSEYSLVVNGENKKISVTKAENLFTVKLETSTQITFSIDDSKTAWLSTRSDSFPTRTNYECGEIEYTPDAFTIQDQLHDRYAVTIKAFEKDYSMSWYVPAGEVAPAVKIEISSTADELDSTAVQD